MSNDLLIACLFLWIVFCVLLAFCASFAGRSVLQVILVSIFLTPLAGFLLLIYLGWQRRASKLRGCPYCLQPIEPRATACHHCLRAVPSVYLTDRAEKSPTLIYCFSGVGILIGIFLIITVWPASDESDSSPESNLSAPSSEPRPQISDESEAAPSATPTPTPPESIPPPDFGNGWVKLKNGEKITDITNVMPAPEGQVTLITVDTGRNISEDELPAGFLQKWGINVKRQ